MLECNATVKKQEIRFSLHSDGYSPAHHTFYFEWLRNTGSKTDCRVVNICHHLLPSSPSDNIPHLQNWAVTDLHGNNSNKRSRRTPPLQAVRLDLLLWAVFLSPHFTYSPVRRSTIIWRLFVERTGSHVMSVALGIGSSTMRAHIHVCGGRQYTLELPNQ